MSGPWRVVVVDDHEVVRSGLRALLATVDDIEVVAEAASGEEATSIVGDLLPDVVLMDLQMPGGNGIDATRTITSTHPSVAVLVLTMYEDDDSVYAALRAGARGYLLKGAGQGDLVRSIAAVASGDVVIGPGAAERLLTNLSAPSAERAAFPQLTDREYDVLRLVAEGLSNPGIGQKLGLAPKTVANHVSNILTKLAVMDRAEAILRARQAGLGAIQNPGDPTPSW